MKNKIIFPVMIRLCKKLILIFAFLTFTTSLSFSQSDTIFTYFAATQVEDGVLISFTIKGGITCLGVKIERSNNGVDYEVIHEFLGVCGGVSADESYAYTDTNPYLNIESYYRLDLGSLGFYSDVISVKFIDYNTTGVTFFPNPCNDECTLYFTNSFKLFHEAFLYNTQGKLVLNESIKGDQWTLKRQSHPSGIYFYRLFRDGEERKSGKVLFP